MVEKAEAKSEGGNEFQQWHRSVAALLIWSEEKDAVWSLSFPGQIMEPNFGSMFPFFQKKKKLYKGQGRKWKLFYFPVVYLFLQMTPVPSCCALIYLTATECSSYSSKDFRAHSIRVWGMQILLQIPQAAPPSSLSLKHGSDAGKPLTLTLFLPQGTNISGRGSGQYPLSRTNLPVNSLYHALEILQWVFSMPAARLGSCFSRCCFLRKWVNAWWLEWCGKKAYLCEVLANCLARVTECCSKFPGFRNCHGSGLTGQKDLQKYTNKWKYRGKNHWLAWCKKNLVRKSPGLSKWLRLGDWVNLRVL